MQTVSNLISCCAMEALQAPGITYTCFSPLPPRILTLLIVIHITNKLILTGLLFFSLSFFDMLQQLTYYGEKKVLNSIDFYIVVAFFSLTFIIFADDNSFQYWDYFHFDSIFYLIVLKFFFFHISLVLLNNVLITWDRRVAQWLKAPNTKLNDLNLFPGAHVVE